MSLFDISDVPALKASLAPAWSLYMSGVDMPSDADLLKLLQSAEAAIARDLKVFLEPTVIFPYEPSTEEIAALDGQAWVEEPGYDYDACFFQGDRWGYMILRQRPTISIEYIRFAYPTAAQVFYDIPTSWMRIDKKPSHVNLIPNTSVFSAPLNAFMLQAIGGGTRIPFMIQVKYVAGLKDVKSDPRWADLVNVIFKKAAGMALEGLYLPSSGSISADGMSQSLSFDGSKYRELINETLFGPKGANGGLYTAIHGLSGTIFGALM